jgi:hypothetical protein
LHRSTESQELESGRSGQTDTQTLALSALLLMIIACTVFANAALNGFVLDDQSIIVSNPLIRSLSGVPVLFESDYWEPTSREGLYRPVSTMSYALDYAVSENAPLGYHVTNILLHAVNSVLVLLVLASLTRHAALAWTAAVLFAVHPIHTEVVAARTKPAGLSPVRLFDRAPSGCTHRMLAWHASTRSCGCRLCIRGPGSLRRGCSTIPWWLCRRF